MYFVKLVLRLCCAGSRPRRTLSPDCCLCQAGPQANGSLRVYKQQAAEGASSFYGVFPKEAEPSLPQVELHT